MADLDLAGIITRTCSDLREKFAPISHKHNASDIEGGGVLPTVTTADNGKVLQVVNGAWAASSLPSASGVSF